MSLQAMMGAQYMPNYKWAPNVQISPESVGWAPHEELIIDPYLPTLSVDPYDPAGAMVIPGGRFVSFGWNNGQGSTHYRFLRTDTGRTTLTIHDGTNFTPAGMSVNQMYKKGPQDAGFSTDSFVVKYKKQFQFAVPYVLAINEAYGSLSSGDKISGYFGSTTSTSNISTLHKGKPVKWTPNTLYVVSLAGSALAVGLPAAIYPAFKPTVVYSTYNTTAYAGTAATLAWSTTSGYWTATFATGVTQVWYTCGQNADQIGGEVVRIQSLTDMLTQSNFERWAEYAPNDQLNYPPAATRYPTTYVASETPATVVAGVSYRVAYYPMDIFSAVTVTVSGATIVDMYGNSTTYSGAYVLPTTATKDTRQWFIGNYHNVNWRTGVITLSENITSLVGITVSYSYISNPLDGAAAWGAGIWGLTDGSAVNTLSGTTFANQRAGVPAYLNVVDTVGVMRGIAY